MKKLGQNAPLLREVILSFCHHGQNPKRPDLFHRRNAGQNYDKIRTKSAKDKMTKAYVYACRFCHSF